jgi:nitrile hydratase beta subunit
MERAHDLGGQPGSGPVQVVSDEPVFSAAWERTARALVYAASMAHPNPTTSGFRDAIERMAPEHYLASSYYERWLTAAASLAVEGGAVSTDELEATAGGPFPLAADPVPADAVAHLEGGRADVVVGQAVRVRDEAAPGHTRCPRYVRGRCGVVVAVQGSFSLPDVEAHSRRRVREHVYTVRFSAHELWGQAASPAVHVNVGLWASYLEAA